MGIYHFFSWFQKKFSKSIHKIKKSIYEISHDISVDNVIIDMNGIFHTSAQKIFRYGGNKPKYELKYIIKENRKTQLQVFEDICNSIEKILITTNPKKRLILCVDGTAPVSKQVQMRKRRFKSSLENQENPTTTFDSASITPGTKFTNKIINIF